MTDEPEAPKSESSKPGDLQDLWQDQPMEFTQMSLQAIHDRANRFQSTIFWRNTREYVASLLVTGVFGWYAWQSDDPIFRLSCWLIIVGAAFICLFLFLNGRADRAAVQLDGDCLAFHRNALRRQKRLLSSVWLWYLLPMVPGLSLFLWTTGRNMVATGVFAAVFIGVWALNAWGARCLDKELARLED